MKKISLFLPDLRGGGAEKVAVNLANEMVRRGFDIDVVLIKSQGELLVDLDPLIDIIDLDSERIRSAVKPYISYLQNSKPDVILASMWPLTSIAIIANRLAKSQSTVIVSEHTTWSRSQIVKKLGRRWMTRLIMSLTFPFADGIITVSKGVASDLARFSFTKRQLISVIYNPVVDERKLECCDSFINHQWPKAKYHILSVGTLKPVKDFATLLKAFALARKKVDVSLIILGEGELKAELLALSDKLGISSHVLFPGFVRNTIPYYQFADLFVLSSLAEGFGNVIVESMASGTPVVATDCQSGPREILNDGEYGKLVPVSDVDALANAIVNSIKEIHDLEALKQRASDFTIDKITSQYLKVMLSEKQKHIGTKEVCRG